MLSSFFRIYAVEIADFGVRWPKSRQLSKHWIMFRPSVRGCALSRRLSRLFLVRPGVHDVSGGGGRESEWRR